jgi:PAS domain S-box-containing protein
MKDNRPGGRELKTPISLSKDDSTGTLLYSSIFESCFDAIDFKTSDGVIRAWNPAAERLYGFEAREMIGKHVSCLYTPEHYEEFEKLFELSKEQRRSFHFESTRVTRDGAPITVFVTLSPVFAHDGHLLGVSAISRDISKKKQLVAEKHRLTQDREELLSIIGNDVLNSIHQLNRIITALDNDPARAEVSLPRAVLEALLKSNNEFERAIENLLMVYSLGPGDKLAFSPLYLVEFLKAQIDRSSADQWSSDWHRRGAGASEIELETEIDGDNDVLILADERMLKRLFSNTVDWAVSQCRDKSVMLKVKAMQTSPTVEILIDFNGKFYDDTDIHSLFSSRWREVNGAETGSISGLGLFLARWTAEAHGGRLTFTSTKACNSFAITLPKSQTESTKVVELAR